MEIRILSSGPCDQKLINTIQSLADYIGANFKIETRVLFSTDNKQLLNLVDQLTGSKPGVPIEVSPVKSPALTTESKEPRLCESCGASFIPQRKDQKLCGDPKCKKVYQAKYNAGHLTKKQIKSVVPAAEVSPDPGPLSSQPGME